MKKTIVTIIIAVLTLLCISSCKKVENSRVMVEKSRDIAEEYFLKYMENNWAEVYDYLAIPESPFTTKEAFLSFINQTKESRTAVQIEDYTIQEIPIESEYEKKYKIEYMLTGAMSPKVLEVDLIKQNNNSELAYKVSPKEFIAENYSITVPLDSTISIDDILVDSAYKTGSIYEDKYLINYIFNGKHSIFIDSEYLEDVNGTFIAETDGEERFWDFEITDESLNEMCSTLASMANSVYNAAINGKSFDAVRNLYAPDCDINRVKEMYTNLYNEIHPSDGGGLKAIEFSNVQLRSDYNKEYRNGGFSFVGMVTADLTNSYYNRSKNEIVKTRPALMLLPNTIEAEFRYIDGKWQVEILYVGLHSSSASLQ